ncbi:MAG: glutamate--tRNA ligase [Acidimicrobiia bacterium]
MTVRVRFAPSPTGFLHVGGGRTALYNWLFARSEGGTLILRSDDTDEARSTTEYAADIVTSLRWLGLDWDEGVEVGGPHGEYRQSHRLERYRRVAHELVASGLAYHGFETEEQLEAFRLEAKQAGRAPAYDGRHRLDDDEAKRRVEAGESAPIRFAVPRPGETRFEDAVKGEVVFDHTQVDDFVILRSDGSPTYHLASTVDDVDFAITHVIRGEDLLPSTPKHILLTEAMGAARPTYAHLSLLMGPDGSKLSKRHGHTALAAYRADGYLPEAMANYLAILGWSPGEDDEVVPLEDMVPRFFLGSVSRNPSVFDPAKLEWMNGVYLRMLAPDDFVARALPFVETALGRPLEPEETDRVVTLAPLVQERVKRLDEVGTQVAFLFDDVAYDQASWDKVMSGPEVPLVLARAMEALRTLEPWSTQSIEVALRRVIDELGLSARKGLQPLRVAVTGSAVSPPLFESIAVLGRERTLPRLTEAGKRLLDRFPTSS